MCSLDSVVNVVGDVCLDTSHVPDNTSVCVCHIQTSTTSRDTLLSRNVKFLLIGDASISNVFEVDGRQLDKADRHLVTYCYSDENTTIIFKKTDISSPKPSLSIHVLGMPLCI